MTDPGYSSNAAQFSYKLNATLISSTKKAKFITVNSQTFYDEDAYQFFGYSILPELKYYFTWDAPTGVYLDLFGNYTSYTSIYTDITISEEFFWIPYLFGYRNYNVYGKGWVIVDSIYDPNSESLKKSKKFNPMTGKPVYE